MILQAPVAMCILKGSRHIVEIANDRMFQLWGKPSAKLLGKPVFDALTDAKYEGFENLLTNVFTTGETYKGYGAPVTLFRGEKTELVYCHFVYEALRDSDNSISGVMVVAVEVTDEVVARKNWKSARARSALWSKAPHFQSAYM